MEPTTTLETVTPERARAWLEEANVENRTLREKRVQAIADAILRDEWQVNGDTLKFGTDGLLLDGQHRLAAIVRADREVRTFVCRGVAREARPTIDTGSPRDLTDVLVIERHAKYAKEIAATIRTLCGWETGDPNNMHRATVTRPYGLAVYDADSDGLTAAAQLATHVYGSLKPFAPPKSVLAACAYKFSQLEGGREDAAAFFEQVARGVGLQDGDPALVLRDKLQKLEADRKRRRTDPPTHAALIVKAWNAFRGGRKVQVLAYSPGGAKREGFPEPV